MRLAARSSMRRESNFPTQLSNVRMRSQVRKPAEHSSSKRSHLSPVFHVAEANQSLFSSVSSLK